MSAATQTEGPNASSAPVTIYRPNQRHELGFVGTWVIMSLNVWNSRELIWQLFKRDFFAAYKKSFIGFTWIFFSPIMGIVSWLFLKEAGVMDPGDLDIPYTPYVLLGTSMWGLFMGFFNAANRTLTAGQALVLQVNYPHEALLFKETAQVLANFVLSFIVNIVVLLAFKVIPTWGLLLFPLVALPLFFLGAAIGLVASMLSIVAVDISRVIIMGMGFLMYLTPLIYTNKIANPLVQYVIKWNPLTYLVCSCRDVIIYGRLYDTTGYFICASISVVLFLVSWRLFYVSEQKIVERMI